MKDYSKFLGISKNEFIKYHKVKGDKIIVKFARRKKIIPYSKEEIEYILHRMKNQVKHSVQLDIEENVNNTGIGICNAMIIACCMSVIFIFMTVAANTIMPLIMYLAILFLCAGVTSISIIINKSKLKDFEKNKLFVDNEQKINDYFKEKPSVIVGMSRKNEKLINECENIEANEQEINLSTIHKMKYKQLKEILNAIEQYNDFSKKELDNEEKGPKKMKISNKR